ncbi:NAD(P)H-dependent oxidoreductase [Rubneribacter sp.]|nr:NAD(P)H-dependent oxidoreductase [Candidatus Rubneribacter avistercoris]
MTTLFVNACMRGEESRTLALCREYLAGKQDVVEVDLAKLRLAPFDAEMVAHRTEKQLAGEWDDPVFALSRQFAQADDIVVGAPYWDLSFPAALKIYLEHVSVCESTFHYTEDARCEGLCRAQRLTYITTCGGRVEGANFGYEYLCGIAKMFGIPQTRFVAAEDLDVVGVDVEAQMDKARAQLAALRAAEGERR